MSSRVKEEPIDLDDVKMSAADVDPEDEIVREIDVFLSPALASQAYLIQYPLQHRSPSLPIGARIKPNHGMLELDHAIPQTVTRDSLPCSLNLPHRTHTSHTIPVSTHLALAKMEVGVNNSSQLHLVPLTHVVQMRPDFGHMNETAPSNEAEKDNMEEDAAKLEKKPVMFQKKESERAAMARQSSYAYKKASEDSEQWHHLEVKGPGTMAYARAFQSLKCPSPNVPLATTKLNAGEVSNDASASFVRSLNYLTPETTTIDEPSSASEEAVEGHDLKQVCAKLVSLLQQGWPVPYSVIQPRFSSLDDSSLLTALSACAVCVRGNLVLQSRYLSMPKPVQEVRTFLLFLLQCFGFVQRFRVDHVFRDDAVVTPEVTLMLLEQIAKKGDDGWEPKLEDNASFYDEFQGQTLFHVQYWERCASDFAIEVQEYQQAPID